MLSDVKCSTRNKQYAQWLLATRSFAIVSCWSAIVNFYRNLLDRLQQSNLTSFCSKEDKDASYLRLKLQDSLKTYEVPLS
jgi:hypothetical protein